MSSNISTYPIEPPPLSSSMRIVSQSSALLSTTSTETSLVKPDSESTQEKTKTPSTQRAAQSPDAYFKKVLMLKGADILHALDFNHVDGEICIYNDKAFEYTLLRSLDPLSRKFGSGTAQVQRVICGRRMGVRIGHGRSRGPDSNAS